MAPAGHAGEDAALFETVKAVGMELCPQLGVSIPVGKDSMSMKTVWNEAGENKAVTSPIPLVVTAFAAVPDARKTLTPQLLADAPNQLILIDLGAGKIRMGGSSLAQVYNAIGDTAPDVDDAGQLAHFFATIQALNKAGDIHAYHDRSDGGLFTTLVEMSFAGHCGLEIDITTLPGDAVSALYNEELGAVIQVPAAKASEIAAQFNGLAYAIGQAQPGNQITIKQQDQVIFSDSRISLHRMWSDTTYHMQKMRDNPTCAQQEYDRILDEANPGLANHLTFDPAEDIAAPYINTGARPKMAILREQGVNGQTEMAMSFDRAGFASHDVHMSDIISGRVSLKDFVGFVACGGFSYGDVLGAGEGWAKSILFNSRAREEFSAFFERQDSFALGICNGCQMMSNLRELIPGAAHWPHFVKNKSEQFEARIAMVEITESPSFFFNGMVGSKMPIAVAHGEGYAEFSSQNAVNDMLEKKLVTMRFVDNALKPTEVYPYNPSGSPQGIAGLTSTDGRFSIMMPHPERVVRNVQNTWQRFNETEDGAWIRLFRNARTFIA
jgi:phosphoribosylformylglycinamidine synthase